VQLLSLPHERDTEVLGLDIAMGHTLLFQPVHDLKEILPKALQQLQVKAALLAQALGQGLVSRPVHQDADPTLIVAFLVELDDELVAAQLAQHVGLGLEPCVVLRL